MIKSARMLILAMGVLAVGGCGIFASDEDVAKANDKQVEKKLAKEKAKLNDENPPICPQVAIIRELDTVRDFAGEKPAPDQLTAAAHMRNVTGNCAYQDKGIDITFELNIDAVRGPRLGGLHANLPFFVAVVDPAGTILNKDKMTATINFSSDTTSAVDTEALHIFIPLAKNQQRSGPDYQVLSGFQLTQEQFDQAVKGTPE